MSVEAGSCFMTKESITTMLKCGSCSKYLGDHVIKNGHDYNEIENWQFCPYCGSYLDLDNLKLI